MAGVELLLAAVCANITCNPSIPPVTTFDSTAAKTSLQLKGIYSYSLLKICNNLLVFFFVYRGIFRES